MIHSKRNTGKARCPWGCCGLMPTSKQLRTREKRAWKKEWND